MGYEQLQVERRRQLWRGMVWIPLLVVVVVALLWNGLLTATRENARGELRELLARTVAQAVADAAEDAWPASLDHLDWAPTHFEATAGQRRSAIGSLWGVEDHDLPAEMAYEVRLVRVDEALVVLVRNVDERHGQEGLKAWHCRMAVADGTRACDPVDHVDRPPSATTSAKATRGT